MKKRLPLTGVYNTRPGTLALSGSSGVVGIGIVGLMVVGQVNYGSYKDHRLINCLQITQSDPTANTKRLQVVKWPGFAVSMTPAAGSIATAVHVWSRQADKVMSCFGGTNSTLYDSTTSKGALTGKATGITETTVSGTPTLTIPTTDSTGWFYQDGGSATKITDADFPGNASRTIVGQFAHLDGYAFIMDSVGRIYNGDLNSITAWTAASYITANSVPDVGIGVVENRNVLVAFCKEHIDVFRNTNATPLSPLSRIDGLSKKVGCISADAMDTFKDVIYFAGGEKGANIGIHSYDAGQIKKHSTPEIDAALTIAGAANISLTSIPFFGRNFIVVIAASSTFAYCIEEGTWHERNGTQLWYKASGIYAISNDSTSGSVYVLNPANVVYSDEGVSGVSAIIQTANFDGGTALGKFLSSLRVIGDLGSGVLYVSWSDDDYQTWSVPRGVDMTTLSPLTRCGRFERRAFLLSHGSGTGIRLEALELDYEEGTS